MNREVHVRFCEGLRVRLRRATHPWWSWYVRLAHPKSRLEAITSRPKLLAAVGRLTSHAGQNKILLTITHEAGAQIKQLIANVRAGLRHVIDTAPQLDKSQRWYALARYIVEQIVACRRTPNELLTFAPTG